MISTEQLHAAGLSTGAIKHRVREGRLTREHQGVYRYGPVTPPLGPEAAAVLACGPDALLSHRSAAALWGLIKRDPTTVDVTAPTQRRKRNGIRPHQAAVPARDRRRRNGLPLTSPLRSVLDLRTQVDAPTLYRAVREGQYLKLLSDHEVTKIPGFEQADVPRDAEDRLATILHNAGLPTPQRNVHRGRWELDFFWPEHNLALELDGKNAHAHRIGFTKDREKSLDLASQGIETLSVTWPQAQEAKLLVTLARKLPP